MKKVILPLICCVLAYPCAAQKNLSKWFRSFRSRPAVPEAAAPMRSVQGKMLPSPGRVVVPSWQRELEKYVARTAAITPAKSLRFVPSPLPPFQKREFAGLYLNTMRYFHEFKQDADVFLYYQIKPSERRELAPEERKWWLEKSSVIEKKLVFLTAIVDPKQDAALAFALDYVARVRGEAVPMLKGVSGPDLYFSRRDRRFVGDEFYLHDSELNRWKDMFFGGQARAEAEKMPHNLRIAVLNDRQSVLDNMTASHQKGVFNKNGTLECFSRVEDLLASVRAGHVYDLILTDIIIADEGGGYLLTHTLRLSGFPGAIIALSAYERNDAMGIDMFERGFDGMLNLPIGFEDSPFWEADVMRGLNKYFSLRSKHGWNR